MEELYALSPFKPIFIAKSVQGVGDFQVAIGGGFWVAVRGLAEIVANMQLLQILQCIYPDVQVLVGN